MSAIPSCATWLAQTELRVRPRSSALKKLDAAIKAYETSKTPGRVKDIRVALAGWKRHNGENWKASPRNKAPNFPFTNLAKAIYVDLKLPPDEVAALKFWDDSRRRKLQTLFAGKTVQLRIVNSLSQMVLARKNLEQAVAGTRQTGVGLVKTVVEPEVTKAVNEMFGTQIAMVRDFAAQAAAETGAAAVAQTIEHVASMLPIISLVADGTKMLAQWGQAIYKGYKQYDASTHAFAIERGDAAAAFDAVRTLLARETANQVAKASITSAAFGANVALHAAKGAGAVLAPAVGAAKAAANAARVIAKFAIEFRETVLVNKVLKDPENLDLRAFKLCPLLGAYMLVCSDTSDLVVMLFDEFGQAGWMDDMERVIKHHIHPAQKLAAGLVQDSPFIISGVPLHRPGNSQLSTMSVLSNFM